MANVAVIVAAGSGSRMQSAKNKVLLPLCGTPVIARTVAAFADLPQVDEVLVVCRPADVDAMSALLPQEKVSFVFGGKTRQESVQNAVDTIDDCDLLLIHDGARPLVTRDEILDTLHRAEETGAAATGVFVKDTIKVINDDYEITDTPDRSQLIAIQTPQIFRFDLYKQAMEKAKAQGGNFTDDCKLMENLGVPVSVVIGEYTNMKITTPEDLPMAEAILKAKGGRVMRIGHGYDVHKLVEGRPLILGGVTIPFEKGLLGHSDADVLLHAISDALLGAAALGDIGHLFPDTDDRWKGADSLKLLEEVVRVLADRGYQIENIDATLLAQRPKLAPYIDEMRGNIADACRVDIAQVSVKATTEEGLGFTGTGAGMAAHAVALIEKA